MDELAAHGALFLGSRLKRLGERMQADVARVVERAGLPIQPSQYPLLAALDRTGPLTVGQLAAAVGLSQPAITRTLARLVELSFVASDASGVDQRRRPVVLTDAGRQAVARSKRDVWPAVAMAVEDLLAGVDGGLLAQLSAIEARLAATPLDRHLTAGLKVLPWSDDRAAAFHDINVEWIEAMFVLEDADREVLDQPREKIIAPGGDILFVAAEGLGVVGTCALRNAGGGAFELTKMGVLDAARGRKAGEFLLRATIARAGELGADPLYLLTNSKCRAAIHLYEKLGFVHDAAIQRDYGARYARADVAMRYVSPTLPS